ncbi:MAG: iron chelate uptake ABC transporter family permease subunit, partial [Paracoccus sp. (in: a-proteobacteria)]|nr:iron chelate uptake ABC transporter family permease subunit [Paracoccus sp. (in: a-proteobacteria)]
MPYPALLAILSVLVLALFTASLTIGPAGLSARQGLAALLGQGDPMASIIMHEIRLPRAILGALIGAALGLAGAAMQGYLRNPLAEPGLIGTSASASLGAVLAIHTGLAAAFAPALPLAALLGAALSAGLVMALAGPGGGALALILAGIAISALAAAATSLVLNLAPNPWAASEIVFWMMGSLADRSMLHVAIAAPLILLGALILGQCGRGLRALTLGEDAAAAMGVDPARLRLSVLSGTAALVG